MKISDINQAIEYIEARIRYDGYCTLEDFDDVFAPEGVPLRQVLELFFGLHTDPHTNYLTLGHTLCRRNPFANYPEELSRKPSERSSVVSLPAINMTGMCMSVTGAINFT